MAKAPHISATTLYCMALVALAPNCEVNALPPHETHMAVEGGTPRTRHFRHQENPCSRLDAVLQTSTKTLKPQSANPGYSFKATHSHNSGKHSTKSELPYAVDSSTVGVGTSAMAADCGTGAATEAIESGEVDPAASVGAETVEAGAVSADG